jgi:5-methyltetrahydropteroyltriglutamate--homocysteine methyltransferase
MFATFAGGYSRKPLPAQPDLLGVAERDLIAGRIDEDRYREVADEFVREVLNEMAVVGLGIVGDGGARAPDRVLPWIDGLDGVARGGQTTLHDGERVTRPIVEGTVRWTRALTVRDWRFAQDEAELPVKQTLFGPYTLAALAEPTSSRRRASLADAFGDALNAELRALAAAGCPMVEVDEPMALQIGDDAAGWRTFRAAHDRLSTGLDGEPAIHLSLGLWGGEIDPSGHATLIELPYRSYLVDVLAGRSAWRFINSVPATRGIIVGAGDATTGTPDETEVLIWAMAWAAQGERGPDRVGIAPNGSLVGLDRHFAHRKCLRLGEAVRIASMGPLQNVAEDLADAPERSKLPELRTMAAAVAEARRA